MQTCYMYYMYSHFVNIWMVYAVHKADGRGLEWVFLWQIHTHFPHTAFIRCCKKNRGLMSGINQFFNLVMELYYTYLENSGTKLTSSGAVKLHGKFV